MVKDFAGRHVLRSKSAIPHSMIAIGSVAVEKESGNIARIEVMGNGQHWSNLLATIFTAARTY